MQDETTIELPMAEPDPVLVIGAGIAGIQSSLDLAEAGVQVWLIDRKPSIGGLMAALDKNFPTLDCSICIQAPVMSEAMNHANVTVKAQTEVIKVEGDVNTGFTVTMKEKARYVTDECTRCNLCVDACPQLTVNEFDKGMGYRKAIYTPFAQAEPGAYTIDMDTCLNTPGDNGVIDVTCRRCSDACLPNAIDFTFPAERTIEKRFSSIITSTGVELLDATIVEEYGYGKHEDILTSMEYERMLNAAGPTEGHIIRPSTHQDPKNVLFVLCAGSRDQRYVPYCSRVCCMYSIKEAYQTVDHGVKDVTVLYMDLRAYGKGFDEFQERTLKEGIKYIRGRPSKIDTTLESPLVVFENTETGEIIKESYDLIVLAPALLPSRGTDMLAKQLQVDLDTDGFIETQDYAGYGVKTSRDGIYTAGSAGGPKDIPDSVAEASAAAAAAMTHVPNRIWPLEEYEETIDPNGEEKVGVFVCDCGSNIAGVIDVPGVVEYAKSIPGVAHAEEVMFACSGSITDRISETIKEKGLTRLIVSACSPKTHQKGFARAAAKAGLNPYLVEMTNLRNHNSWVHKKEPKAATKKAKDMVRMSIEKARLLTPLKETDLHVIQKAIIVGGGPSGLAAAWNLANQGYETHLVEKSDKLGGMLNKIQTIAPSGIYASDVRDKMIADATEKGVIFHLGKTITEVTGYVGNFHLKMNTEEELDVGAIVLAYGGSVYTPKPITTNGDMKVMTSQELDLILEEPEKIPEKNITFQSCVGSRLEDKGCSRYCCTAMIYEALKLKEQGKNVTVLYRDIRTYNRHAEEMYYEAARKGVVFMHLPRDVASEDSVTVSNGHVLAYDELLEKHVAIPTDLLVQVVGISPPVEHDVADLLRVSKGLDGHLMELHPKLGPVEAAVQGVYLAGVVRGPVNLDEAISQGLGAASKASELLARDITTKEPLTAQIDPDRCTGCTRCADVCTYGAIIGEKKELHQVIEAACMGCGNCASECRYDAIVMPGFTTEQINAQIDEALAVDPEEKVLVFACNWCSYAGADGAGIAKIQYPPSSVIIRTMCSARINSNMVSRAFENGAGAVMVTGCRLTSQGSDCHYNFANVETEKRFNRYKRKLSHKDESINERLRLEWISAAEGKKFAEKLFEMDEIVKKWLKTMPLQGGD